jgi:ribosomal protein S27E
MSLPTTLLRCPACGTVFRGPATLPAHRRVRCGVCGEVFAAPADGEARAAPAAAARPAYVSRRQVAARGARGPWRGVLAALLTLTLLGQLAWLARQRLATVPVLRPAVAAVCQRLGCRLPPFRDLRAIRVDEARITSHPDYAQALLVVATVVNTASLAQPWPRLALALTGVGGVVVAERVFEPAEYLPAERQGEGGFAPGSTVEIRLPLADPGAQAAGFRLNWY